MSEGTRVRVNFRRDPSQGKVRNSDFYYGNVTLASGDGDAATFSVEYDDGDKEKDVKLEWVQFRPSLDGGA